ncbi:MAG: thymidylate kinase [Microthrixaceae bacterium]|nr:thymidylate kinase [Microthrixaceae bacterium]
MTASPDGRSALHLPRHPDGRGCFVVFEGGEGSGKSTQAEILARHTGALLTRQPGGTELGVALRGILLDGVAGEVAPRTEALLMAADRAQHVQGGATPPPCGPAGQWCVTATSGRRWPIRATEEVWTPRMSPGCRNGPSGVSCRMRLSTCGCPDRRQRREPAPRDRIEAAGEDFHKQVLDGFDAQAEADPNRWVVVDGTGTVEQVTARVAEALVARSEPT